MGGHGASRHRRGVLRSACLWTRKKCFGQIGFRRGGRCRRVSAAAVGGASWTGPRLGRGQRGWRLRQCAGGGVARRSGDMKSAACAAREASGAGAELRGEREGEVWSRRGGRREGASARLKGESTLWGRRGGDAAASRRWEWSGRGKREGRERCGKQLMGFGRCESATAAPESRARSRAARITPPTAERSHLV